jgi:hypothetical protein
MDYGRFEIARVNAALTIACAVHLIDDPEQSRDAAPLDAETETLVEELVARRQLPHDLGCEMGALLVSCRPPGSRVATRLDALAALRLAVRAAQFAAGSTPPDGRAPAFDPDEEISAARRTRAPRRRW